MKRILLIIALLLLVLSSLIIGFIKVAGDYRSSHVVSDGTSMEPTIHNGQQLSVAVYENANQIKRGDIVEYHSVHPLAQQYTSKGKLVHRVIALPGDRITVSKGKVVVYNTEHPEGFNPDTYLSPTIITNGTVDITMPSGQYFVMGDNRPNALDSRAIGTIAFSDIIGKVSQ